MKIQFFECVLWTLSTALLLMVGGTDGISAVGGSLSMALSMVCSWRIVGHGFFNDVRL